MAAQLGQGACLMHQLVSVGDVVVVTINYRLGVLVGLRIGSRLGTGLGSARGAALGTTQYCNVGGETNSVTLFGESYGGRSVSAQLTSPACDLFQRAIIKAGLR